MARQGLIFDNEQIIAPKKRFVVPNFAEGFVDAVDVNMLPPNAIYKGQNVVLGKIGSAETRKGVDGILTTVPDTKRMRSLGWFKREGETDLLVAAYDDKLGKVKISDWTVTEITSGLTNTTDRFSFFSYKDKFYTLCGENMQVYDNSTVWSAGVTAPVAALTAAIRITAPEDVCKATETAGATTLTGTYKYKVAFVTASGTSGVSALGSDAITVAAKDIDLSNIPIGPTGVTARKIYRTKANGIVYYLVATIADNTTTIYADAITDANLGAEVEDDSYLNGAYTYRVTFVNGTRGQSTAGPVSNSIDVINGQIALTSIPTGAAGCTQRKIYRTEGDGADETQRLLTTIDDNTTTTYTDNLQDADLTTTVDTVSNVPADFTFGLFKKKSATLWAVDIVNNPNRIWICEALYPEVCKSDSYINLPNNDEITAIAEYFDNIYIFCKHAIYKITGESISDIAVSVISQFTGCASRDTLRHLRQDITFMSYEGIFTLQRVLQSSNAETVDVKPLSEKVKATFDDTNWEYAHMACARVFNDYYIISFPKGKNTVQNNITMIYDINLKAWTPPQTGPMGTVASMEVGDISGDNNYKIFLGTSTQTGKIYKWPGTAYNDDGQAIDSWLTTGVIDAEISEAKKRWKEFYVEVELSGDWNLYCWYRKYPYYKDTQGWVEKTVSLNPGASSSLGDVLTFYPVNGFFPVKSFGSTGSSAIITVDTKGRAMTANTKYLQFKFGNDGNYNEHFKIFKLVVYYRPKKARVN